MARIVMKFGGTSVADLDRIRNAARRIAHQVAQGDEVAVVVSAMAGVTDALVPNLAGALVGCFRQGRVAVTDGRSPEHYLLPFRQIDG